MRKIRVNLFNRYAVLKWPYDYERIKPYFCFKPKNYQYMPKYKQMVWDDDAEEWKHRWDGTICLLRKNRIASGVFLGAKDKIEKDLRIKFVISDFRERLEYKKQSVVSDRDYQNKCVSMMISCISGGLVLAATRTGKTRIVAMYCQQLVGSLCFVVDELTLLYQAKDELESFLKEKIGVVGDSEFKPKRITVATIQTLHKHHKSWKYKDWTQQLDVLVIDEIHLALNNRNLETIRNIKPSVVFGLTATLELDKRNVMMNAYELAGPAIFKFPLEEGVEKKFLVPGIVCAVKIEQPGLLGDYHEEYDLLISKSSARNDVIESLVREAYIRERKTVLLVDRIIHLKRLSKRMEDIPHTTVFGEKEVSERKQAIKDFDKGKIKLIITNKVFKKGITIASIDTIVEASAGKDKNDAIQKYGRGIGLAKGKTGLLYFDINDRSPENVSYDDDEYNRFQKASKSRLKAFKSRSIPITRIEWDDNPEEIFDLAERKLERYITRLNDKEKVV